MVIFPFHRILSGIIVIGLVIGYGYKKRSLDTSGAVTAVIIGMITMVCGGYTPSSLLIMFFISSSILTKLKQKRKAKVEDGFKPGGQRNYVQVLSNSLTATILSVLLFACSSTEHSYDFVNRPYESFLLACVLGHYGCCNGDTWASEVGVLSKSKPYLITTGKQVATGTNGGISLLGTVASICGGMFIGIVNYFALKWFSVLNYSFLSIAILGALSGFIGSMLDSLLGATLQYSGWDSDAKKVVSAPSENTWHICGRPILDNHQVNFFSSLLTAVIIGFIAPLTLH